MCQNGSKGRFLNISLKALFGLTIILGANGCQFAGSHEPPTTRVQPTTTSSPNILEINSMTVMHAAPHFQDAISQHILSSIDQMTASGMQR